MLAIQRAFGRTQICRHGIYILFSVVGFLRNRSFIRDILKALNVILEIIINGNPTSNFDANPS
jgi:hypothetical protein